MGLIRKLRVSLPRPLFLTLYKSLNPALTTGTSYKIISNTMRNLYPFNEPQA